MLEEYLTKLIQELELDPLPPKDEKKMFRLALSPSMTLLLKEGEGGTYLHATIGAPPKLKREEFFILLMKANFLGQGTGGSAVGMDREEKFLTLSLSLPYEINYKAFRETVEDFANFVDYWRQELTRHNQEAEKGIV